MSDNLVPIELPNAEIIYAPAGASKAQIATWLFFNRHQTFFECRCADRSWDQFIPEQIAKLADKLPPSPSSTIKFDDLPNKPLFDVKGVN